MGEAPLWRRFAKLLELDKEDVDAVRSFLPGRILGRAAALLALGNDFYLPNCPRQLKSPHSLERSEPQLAEGRRTQPLTSRNPARP